MRNLLTLLMVLTLAGTALAQDHYPFPVKIGGQAAELVEGGVTHAKIMKPVAANAPMTVENVSGNIIVNIFASDENGNVTQENQGKATVLMFAADSSKGINDKLTGPDIKPGFYLANVVGGGKTSRVVFQVK